MKKILLIEDEELLRILYREELQEEGYEVLLAADGIEGLKILEKTKVDLVITDLHMPRMGGLDTLSHILGLRRKLPVIIYTGHPEYKTNFMSWSADAYLIKSSDLSELKAKIKELTSGSMPN